MIDRVLYTASVTNVWFSFDDKAGACPICTDYCTVFV